MYGQMRKEGKDRMREVLLVFEGNDINEKRAAVLI